MIYVIDPYYIIVGAKGTEGERERALDSVESLPIMLLSAHQEPRVQPPAIWTMATRCGHFFRQISIVSVLD